MSFKRKIHIFFQGGPGFSPMPLQSLANESTDCLSVLQNKSCPKIPSERKVTVVQRYGVSVELGIYSGFPSRVLSCTV